MIGVEMPKDSGALEDSDEVVARWGLPVSVIVVGMFMSVLDITIVNVAIPAVQKDFGGSIDDVLWVATAYTLTLGVVVPVTSWLGDRFGLSLLYIGSLVGFAGGSALCGLAWNLDSLIVFRIMQAVPGGILPVVTLTMLYRIVPKRQVGAAMGLYGLGAIVAPAIGPVLGGYLVDYISWRLVFYINVPVGLLGAIAAYFFVPKIARAAVDRFDFAGFATIALGLFAILLACSEGESWGWSGYRVLGLFTFGVLALALFVVIELQVEHPLLDLRVLKVWPYTIAIVLVGLMFINLLTGAFYIPVFLQQGQGMEAFDAGLLILPQALVMCVVMPASGLLYDRLGPRVLAGGGLWVCAIGTYLMCSMTPSMTREALIIWTCIRAAGMGLAIMPMMTYGINAIPPALTNQASAILNVFQQVAGALGLAALGALATGQQAQLYADMTALVRPDPARPLPAGPLDRATSAAFLNRGLHLQAEILGTSYANIFFVVALLTLGCAAGTLFLRPRPPASDSMATGPIRDEACYGDEDVQTRPSAEQRSEYLDEEEPQLEPGRERVPTHV